MKEIVLGSLVEFLYDFETVPKIGFVVQVMPVDEELNKALGCDLRWYAVQFGDIQLVVSEEMIKLIS